MKNFFIEHMPMNSDGLGEYPDFFALGVTLLFAAAIAFGARESSMINNIFTVLNLSVVLYVIITGSFKADPINWAIPEEEVPEGYGTGGFAPYGLGGVIKGAAICFYGFVGFDCIATCGEEAKNPKKSIPIAVITSLAIIFVAYFAVSTVLTMMVPYYAQDANAPLPHVFRMYGWTVAEYIVSIGAMFGLCASLMGAMFPLPRIIYAMASDGLMFSFMGKIHPKYQTPLYGTLLAGLLTGCIAAMFNLSQLVNMMSIGTLMAYSIVAACVLLLRYEVDELTTKEAIQFRFKETIKQFVNARKFNEPNTFTSAFVTWGVALYCVWCVFFGSVMTFLWDDVAAAEGWAIFLVIFSGLLLIGTLLAINQQPTSGKELSFTVPLVPWIPALSILLNIYLMLQLDYMTWIRFLVWIIIGLAIYFTYGLRNSKEGKKMAIKAAD